MGLSFVEGDQLTRHTKILIGRAGNPYQYRILSTYMVEAFILALTNLGLQQSITTGFILFRIIQNVIVFLLVALYYKKLGLNTYATLLGLSLLAWAMTHTLYESDLAFNTYSDLIFYLAAGLVILHDRYGWIIPIAGLAALNRETSGLIPFMVLSYAFFTPVNRSRKVLIIVAGIACALYALVFFSLRLAYGEQTLVTGYGNLPGSDYLIYNVTRSRTYVQLFATLSLLPFMSIFSFAYWPRSLRAFFWAIVPIWLVVHPFVAIIAETRLFLVPLAMVFIPGTLFGLVNRYNQPSDFR